MARVSPGWLVALFAATLLVSVWLPWLTTTVNGGGRASAVGGSAGSLQLPPRFGVGQLIVLLSAALLVAGAMVGRGLSVRAASVGALLISLSIAASTAWYYRLNVVAPVTAGYGLYLGAFSATGALVCSLWASVRAVAAGSGLD